MRKLCGLSKVSVAIAKYVTSQLWSTSAQSPLTTMSDSTDPDLPKWAVKPPIYSSPPTPSGPLDPSMVDDDEKVGGAQLHILTMSNHWALLQNIEPQKAGVKPKKPLKVTFMKKVTIVKYKNRLICFSVGSSQTDNDWVHPIWLPSWHAVLLWEWQRPADLQGDLDCHSFYCCYYWNCMVSSGNYNLSPYGVRTYLQECVHT